MKSNSSVIVVIALLVAGAAPIALNGGGGAPAWSGGSFATPSTISASGCNAYGFNSESTLGFGRAGADEWCIGTTTSSNYVSVKHNSSKTQIKFNTAPSASVPHLSDYDAQTSGFAISDGTNPFLWTAGGTTKATLGVQSGRTYLCFGAWNTNGVPCLTSTGSDLLFMDSDASSFSGAWDVGSTSVQLRAGTAAAPTLIFDGGTTGFYRHSADAVGVAISGTAAGIWGSATSASPPGVAIQAASGFYLNIADISGSPTLSCTGSNYTGSLIYDYTNHRLYVCNDQSATRAGWDYAGAAD